MHKNKFQKSKLKDIYVLIYDKTRKNGYMYIKHD